MCVAAAVPQRRCGHLFAAHGTSGLSDLAGGAIPTGLWGASLNYCPRIHPCIAGFITDACCDAAAADPVGVPPAGHAAGGAVAVHSVSRSVLVLDAVFVVNCNILRFIMQGYCMLLSIVLLKLSTCVVVLVSLVFGFQGTKPSTTAPVISGKGKVVNKSDEVLRASEPDVSGSGRAAVVLYFGAVLAITAAYSSKTMPRNLAWKVRE